MTYESSGWVDQAAMLPLAFSQVREDALHDLWLVERLPEGARVLLVASGGCTAAALAASPKVEHLHLVDPNQAQLALSRLKSHLLSAPIEQRLLLLGHAEMSPKDRKAQLRNLLERPSFFVCVSRRRSWGGAVKSGPRPRRPRGFSGVVRVRACLGSV